MTTLNTIKLMGGNKTVSKLLVAGILEYVVINIRDIEDFLFHNEDETLPMNKYGLLAEKLFADGICSAKGEVLSPAITRNFVILARKQLEEERLEVLYQEIEMATLLKVFHPSDMDEGDVSITEKDFKTELRRVWYLEHGITEYNELLKKNAVAQYFASMNGGNV